MKRIPLVPPKICPKDDKVTDKLAHCNPKTYDGKYNPVELKEWIWGMEKMFTIVKVLEEKKLSIRMSYLSREVNIWSSIVKDRLLGLEFT